jgi:hypothetical protein
MAQEKFFDGNYVANTPNHRFGYFYLPKFEFVSESFMLFRLYSVLELANRFVLLNINFESVCECIAFDKTE